MPSRRFRPSSSARHHAPRLFAQILELGTFLGKGAPRPQHHRHREPHGGKVRNQGDLGRLPGGDGVITGHYLGPAGKRVRALERNLGHWNRDLLHQRRVDEVSEVEDARNAPWNGGVHRRVVVGDVVVDDLGAQSSQFRCHVSLEALEGRLRELALSGILDVARRASPSARRASSPNTGNDPRRNGRRRGERGPGGRRTHRSPERDGGRWARGPTALRVRSSSSARAGAIRPRLRSSSTARPRACAPPAERAIEDRRPRCARAPRSGNRGARPALPHWRPSAGARHPRCG